MVNGLELNINSSLTEEHCCEAEFLASAGGAAEALQLKELWQFLTKRLAMIKTITDSSSCRAFTERLGVFRLKHIDTRYTSMDAAGGEKENFEHGRHSNALEHGRPGDKKIVTPKARIPDVPDWRRGNAGRRLRTSLLPCWRRSLS